MPAPDAIGPTSNLFYDLPVEIKEHILRFRRARIIFERLLRPPLLRWCRFIRLRAWRDRFDHQIPVMPYNDSLRIPYEPSSVVHHDRSNLLRRPSLFNHQGPAWLLPMLRAPPGVDASRQDVRMPYEAKMRFKGIVIKPRDERFGSSNTSRQELHRAMFGSDIPSRRNRRGGEG